jgi:hypothetical protein
VPNRSPDGKLRPTYEDLLRGVGYLSLVIWPIALMVFPPTNFFSAFGPALTPRIIWLGLTAAAAAVAAFGAFRRYDIKVELPGLLLIHLGPLLYSFSNWWYVAFPDALNPDPTQRVALAIFALIPSLLLLPRTATLLMEARKLHKFSQQSIDSARHLVEVQHTSKEDAK